jgi:hypothetical protein
MLKLFFYRKNPRGTCHIPIVFPFCKYLCYFEYLLLFHELEEKLK